MQTKTNRQEFIAALHSKGIGGSVLEAEMIWKSCCDHALDWMVNKEQPVDMWFIRLHLTANRPDWMGAVAREIVKLQMLPTIPRGYLKRVLGFELASPELLALERDTLQKFVEVEHTSMWTRLIRGVEKTRLMRLNPVGYATEAINALKRNADFAKRRLAKWLANTQLPSAKIVYGRTDRLPRLVPTTPRIPSSYRYVGVNSVFALVRVDPAGKSTKTGRHARIVRRAISQVPSLRAFRFEQRHVRKNRGDVHKPTDEKT